jgi:hypothetical protein
MPPPAPRTATFVCLAAEEVKVRELVERARTAERANMVNVAVVVVEMDVGENSFALTEVAGSILCRNAARCRIPRSCSDTSTS